MQSGEGENLMRHAACPVIFGNKWVCLNTEKGAQKMSKSILFHRSCQNGSENVVKSSEDLVSQKIVTIRKMKTTSKSFINKNSNLKLKIHKRYFFITESRLHKKQTIFQVEGKNTYPHVIAFSFPSCLEFDELKV